VIVSTGLVIYVAVDPIDFRKSIDGLAMSVGRALERDPMSGEVFVFRNRGGNALKALYWGANGFVLVYKRLERGSFRFPEDRSHREWRLDPDVLSRLLAGGTVYAASQ
jgi:transposase